MRRGITGEVVEVGEGVAVFIHLEDHFLAGVGVDCLEEVEVADDVVAHIGAVFSPDLALDHAVGQELELGGGEEELAEDLQQRPLGGEVANGQAMRFGADVYNSLVNA